MSTSTDAPGPAATPAGPIPPTSDPIAVPSHDEIESAEAKESLPQQKPQAQSGFLHSPPESNNNVKSDASDSELSDLEDEPILSDLEDEPILSDAPMPDSAHDAEADDQDDIGEVFPDHWSGTVPVFRPTMHQFKDFQRFMKAVDSYGMKSGIIKIIPPEEWKDSLPPIDELVKRVRVREPIKQDIMGSSGTYRQVNILHGRSYNLPQWRQLCDQSEHQPPARRGERRANADKARPTRARVAAPKTTPKPTDSSDPPKKRGRGRPPKAKHGGKGKKKEEKVAADSDDRPMTPVSPKDSTMEKDKVVESIETEELGEPADDDDNTPRVGRMGFVRPAKSKTQSTSARRKYSRREGSAMIDEAAFKDWDYRMDISEFTPERCEELERVYWKTLTYAPPLYGADLMGTLFDESTELWNLNKLPNILDVLGTKVPGVNTAYLYMGMWKATFAWHLEDVDLYSINYLHFGAPKQWYSISQADARRFEAAMKNIWPQDAKACDQFLRHKAFLISPQHLKQHYGIQVNKCLSYPGEFVVTYPYGYHSGYNLGYNCAEAVNFALDSWLDMGKIAKKCDCAQAQDSVWINVYDIERKLRGESTEYEETEDEEEEEEDDELSGLPTPPASHGIKPKHAGAKRKRGSDDNGKKKVKKIKLRLKTSVETPCCLCPNDFPFSELITTDNGRKAHKLCAMYLPETYIDTVEGKDVVINVENIDKDRLALKCMYCRSKRGACFQCSQKTCARAYHATCAAAAGVFVEEQDIPVFGEDGKEYKEQAFEFSCRFHRTKRDKKLDGDALETDQQIQSAAARLKKGDICQLQYFKGDIFAGCVIENRPQDKTLLLDILPKGYAFNELNVLLRTELIPSSDRLEVDWKWLLLPDSTDYHLPKASANALPMPTSRKAKEQLKATRKEDSTPRKGEIFTEGYTWAEFHTETVKNRSQAKVNLSNSDQIWYYLGKSSTEYRAQYTEDASKPRHNPRGNFLDTVPKPPRPAPVRATQQATAYTYAGPYASPYSAPQANIPSAPASARPDKPYVYKPRIPVEANFAPPNTFTTQRFKLDGPPPPSERSIEPPQSSNSLNWGRHSSNVYTQQQPEATTPLAHAPQQSGPRFPPVPDFVGRFHQQLSTTVSSPGQTQIAPPGYSQGSVRQTPPVTAPQQPARPKFPPHSKAAWQVHTSIYQKYPFFQVNHNRDSSKYQTPYAPWGGFTNGYEGNIRAHLTSHPNDLLRRASLTSRAHLSPNYVSSDHSTQQSSQGTSTTPGGPPYPVTPQPPLYGTNTVSYPPRLESLPSASQVAMPLPQQYARPIKTEHHPSAPATQQNHWQIPQWRASQQAVAQPQPFHQQVSQWKTQVQPTAQQSTQNTQNATQPQTPSHKPKPAAPLAQKSYKIPAKESPVPLPANFLAAITSVAPSPATAAAQVQLTPAASTTSNASLEGSNQVSSTSQTHRTAASPSTPVITEGSKISITPVPIPQLPGMAPPSLSEGGSLPMNEQTGSKAESDRETEATSHASPTGQLHSAPSAPNTQLTSANSSNIKSEPQSFADVPGGGSMDFVERLMQNLRKVSQRERTS
ncbi:hypothetical protein BGZ63DRAFT_427404 [Mariannaea sp. PMI_226]|nr:hypothetical protein BGZ63DRAFT_427404 [Mariannaea sp. PMI_226]